MGIDTGHGKRIIVDPVQVLWVKIGAEESVASRSEEKVRTSERKGMPDGDLCFRRTPPERPDCAGNSLMELYHEG